MSNMLLIFIHRSLYSSDSSSSYLTVSRELVQNLEYRVEALRLDLYKNKEVIIIDLDRKKMLLKHSVIYLQMGCFLCIIFNLQSLFSLYFNL